MKKTLTALFLILGFWGESQTILSTITPTDPKLSQKQVVISDSVIINGLPVYLQIGAIPIQPVIVNAKGDTAFQMNFRAFDVPSDTLNSCNTYVWLSDRKANYLSDFNCVIPSTVLNIWSSAPTPIYNYILSVNPRFVRFVYKK